MPPDFDQPLYRAPSPPGGGLSAPVWHPSGFLVVQDAQAEFPPLHHANRDGIVALTPGLTPDLLLRGYRSGLFPMPFDRDFFAWHAPEVRCVLFLDRVHISHNLARLIRKGKFSCTLDSNFEVVMRACATAQDRAVRGTFITPPFVTAYTALSRAGHAHSVETWLGEKLAGGLYGLGIERFFSGESMFHSEPEASKVALCFLIDRLRARGVKWIDCQVPSQLLTSFGASLIGRDEYMALLREALTPGS